MANIYTPLPYPIRMLLERELRETVKTWEGVANNDEVRNKDIARSNAAYYREQLKMVQEA